MQSLIVVNSSEMTVVRQQLENDGYFVAELDGKENTTEQEFYRNIWTAYKMPLYSMNFNAYLDWVRDLDWLPQKKYALFIKNYETFLNKDSVFRQEIIYTFVDFVLTWWNRDVEKCVVGGVTRPFQIYICLDE